MYRSAVKHTFKEIVRDKKHQRSGKDKSLPLFCVSTLFTIMASPRFDLLAAVRAGAVDHKLNAGAVSAVSAGLILLLSGKVLERKSGTANVCVARFYLPE